MKRIRNVLIILVITLILLFLGVWILVQNEVLHFSWTEDWIREQAYLKARDSKGRKVLVLGDSQLEKWPMKHCLYKDMQAYFDNKDMGYLNAAHHGFGPIEYEDQLAQILPHYTPDIILIFYYAGNDLSDVAYREDMKPKSRTYEVVFEEKGENENNGSTDVSENKAEGKEQVFDWAYYKEIGIDDEIIQYAKNRIEHPSEIGPQYVNPHILNIGAWRPDNHFDNCTMKSVDSKYGWYLSLQRFEGIMKYSDSIGATTKIIVIPSNVQVDTSHYSFYRKTNFRISDELLFANAPQQILYEFSKDSKVDFLDLLPYFKSYDATDKLYFENDDHLSEIGHEYSFEVLKKKIFDPMLVESKLDSTERKKNHYLKYEKWVVHHQIEVIKSDSIWFEQIRKKAEVNQISVDSQLVIDATYVVNYL